MNDARLKIESAPTSGHYAKVWLNDLEISSFTKKLTLVLDARNPNHVTLDLWVDHLEVDANVEAQITAAIVGKIETPCAECGKPVLTPLGQTLLTRAGHTFCTETCARQWSLDGPWSQ